MNREISNEEIIKLRIEGKAYGDIAAIACRSRQRIQQICKGKVPKASHHNVTSVQFQTKVLNLLDEFFDNDAMKTYEIAAGCYRN